MLFEEVCNFPKSVSTVLKLIVEYGIDWKFTDKGEHTMFFSLSSHMYTFQQELAM